MFKLPEEQKRSQEGHIKQLLYTNTQSCNAENMEAKQQSWWKWGQHGWLMGSLDPKQHASIQNSHRVEQEPQKAICKLVQVIKRHKSKGYITNFIKGQFLKTKIFPFHYVLSRLPSTEAVGVWLRYTTVIKRRSLWIIKVNQIRGGKKAFNTVTSGIKAPPSIHNKIGDILKWNDASKKELKSMKTAPPLNIESSCYILSHISNIHFILLLAFTSLWLNYVRLKLWH